MSEKSESLTKLACIGKLYTRREPCLGRMPVFNGNVGQSFSGLYIAFKYFQVESIGYDAWRIGGNVTRMVNTLIPNGGKRNAY